MNNISNKSLINKNNKKFIFVIIVCVLFVGIFLINKYKNTSFDMSGRVREISKDSKDYKLFTKVVGSATKTSDSKKCSEISELDLRQSCESNINYAFDEINLATKKEDCIKLKSNSQYTAEQRQDLCYLNLYTKIAKSDKDYSLCNSIRNTDIKATCESKIKFMFDEMNIAKNSDDCKKLSSNSFVSKEQRQDVCLFNLSNRSSKDLAIKYCNLIMDESMKSQCLLK